MSENTKKVKFNIVDVLIVILIIAAVAVIGVSKFMSSDSEGADTKTVKFTFFAE